MKAITIDLEWPDTDEQWQPAGNLQTQDLPVEVVSLPLSIGIWSYTPDPTHPRRGALSTWIKLGDQENPSQFTEEEAAYIVANLRRVIQIIADRIVLEPEVAHGDETQRQGAI